MPTAHSTLPEFNPSGKPEITEMKIQADSLIVYITENTPANRERALALTNIEQGMMWAVKAHFT